MKKQYFYTLTRFGKFVTKDSMYSATTCRDSKFIGDAIMFDTEEKLLDFLKLEEVKVMRDSSVVEILEVECILREY